MTDEIRYANGFAMEHSFTISFASSSGQRSSQITLTLLALLSVCIAPTVMSQQPDTGNEMPPQFHFSGFATINYLGYDWQTDPLRRNAIELEHAGFELLWLPNNRLTFDFEVEFEGGGTGTTLEFDRFEEFGEYEIEIEKGGSIEIEELFAAVEFNQWLNVRLGHFAVPIGFLAERDQPLDYVTVRRSPMEDALLPTVWDETGIAVFGAVHPFEYELLVVNGLDATGFSSSNWIKRGHQKRFEKINAENLALAGRLIYHPHETTAIGVSGYFGNTADNRPKPDLTVPAHVTVADIDMDVAVDAATFRAMILYGTLENADAVSRANKSLSNNLNVKRTPVGSAVLGYFAEASYNVLPLLTGEEPGHEDALSEVLIFARYDYYDSMFRVSGEVFDNPRWERREITAGLNLRFFQTSVLKAEYSHRLLGTSEKNVENTFAIGMGIQF